MLPEILEDIRQTFGEGAFTPLPGRGNSQVGMWEGSERAFVKIYPQDGGWDRRAAEQRAIEYYLRHGITAIPRILHSSPALNYSVFQYIEGEPPASVPPNLFAQIQEFLCQIMVLPAEDDFSFEAKEAFFTTATLRQHIRQRHDFLRTIEDPLLQDHLRKAFEPCLTAIGYDHLPDYTFDEEAIISPSDFGTHNALLAEDGKLCFIDFEYAGRDSFFKLLGDIYWHPGSRLSPGQRHEIVCSWLATPGQQFIYQNVRLLMGVKWSLLLLNEFIPSNLEKRIKAGGITTADVQKIKQDQLVKSNNVLKQLYDDSRGGIQTKFAFTGS